MLYKMQFGDSPMTFEIKGLDKFQKSMRHLSKQLDYAMTLTINDLSFQIKREMGAEVKQKFGGPLPLAQAFGVRKATKKNIVATVELNDGSRNKNGINYRKKIGHHFTGGKRHHRSSEGAFMYFDNIKKGESATFGQEAKLTKGGYMSGGTYNKILSQLKIADRKSGYSSNATGSKRSKRKRKAKGYFAVTTTRAERHGGRRTRHLRPGVWQRDGGDVLPILMFTKDGTYKKRFNLYKTGSRIVNKKAQDLFYKNMTRALRTAR